MPMSALRSTLRGHLAGARLPVRLMALLVSAFALLALPASASAGEWKTVPASGNFPLKFTGKAGAVKMSDTVAGFLSCASLTGSGEYTTQTTGFVSWTLQNCVDVETGTPCTTSGQAPGTIVLPTAPFHNVYLEPNKTTPGTLTTVPVGGWGKFTCNGGSLLVEIGGNGLIGDLASPKCGETTAAATLVYEAKASGEQKWKTITTDSALGEWDLSVTYNFLGTKWTTAVESDLTLTFAENFTMSCT